MLKEKRILLQTHTLGDLEYHLKYIPLYRMDRYWPTGKVFGGFYTIKSPLTFGGFEGESNHECSEQLPRVLTR